MAIAELSPRRIAARIAGRQAAGPSPGAGANSRDVTGSRSFSEAIPPSVVASLRTLAAGEQTGSTTVLLAAFAILIHRYTRGQSDITLRVSVEGGPAGDLTLGLRDDQSLRDAIRQVAAAVGAAFPDGGLPGLLEGEAGRSAITFQWREPDPEGQSAGAGTLTASLRMGGGPVADLSYWHILSLYDPVLETGSHWQTLLAGLGRDPDAPISRLPLVGPEEERLLLEEFRGAPFDPDLVRDECLHHLFEAQAQAAPERPALFCAGREMTYGELDAQANRLARYLQAHGVGRGSFVGMMLPRSMDVYVAILGILKAGAAYVPIDPEAPADRVAYILEDCAVAALVTTAGLAAGLPAPTCPVVHLDEDGAQIAQQPAGPLPDAGAGPGDPAYVIYTSGSTGRPKGVVIEHRNVCHLVRAEAAVYQVRPEDRVYQGFSVSFDASIEEIWMAFFAGAALVVGTHEMVHAGPALAGMLAEAGVTIVSCVPTLFSMLEEDVPTLRMLIFGGEQCPRDLVARWWKPGRRVINSYGPTEATVVATLTDCDREGAVTIGRPLPNYSVYVLDAQMQPVPVGVPGELHIGGPGVARGYLNRPELTAEKFWECGSLGVWGYGGMGAAGREGAADGTHTPTLPHSHTPTRLYRTGDLVRFVAGGNIEFLGRIDQQVKLRGFRIELSEIESVLMQCPGVQSAVVAVRSDTGIEQLVGYVIPRQPGSFDEQAAREHLRSRLPAYMVPALFMLVADFPTLASGKVDRKRLPAPSAPEPAPRPTGAAGRTPWERAILPVWEKLFHPQQVTPQDDFFALGGHSLLAARMVSELRKLSGMAHVAMLDVYHHPRLEEFAAHVGQRAEAEAKQSERPAPAEQRAPGPSQRRFMLFGAAQAAGLYLVLAVFALPWLAAYEAIPFAAKQHHPVLAGAAVLLAMSFAIWPALLLFSIAAKWILIGRYREGTYPLWGVYHYRFWLARRIQGLVPLAYLRGTPLLTAYYRLMGAEIGSNVHLGSHFLGAYDLISIGDNTSIGVDAQLLGSVFEDGVLKVGPITIGDRCDVGAKSVLGLGCILEDDAEVGEQSLLPDGEVVPRLEQWAGSPARRVGRRPAPPAPEEIADAPVAQKLLCALLEAAGAMLFLPAVGLLAAVPGALMVIRLILAHGLGWGLLAAPAASALFVVLLALEIAGAKWLLVRHVKEGRYPVTSLLYVRKWLVDCLMQMSLEVLHPLYATLYLPPWFRLLGARLGKRVEISTAAHVSPDLLEVGDECFVADSACLGASRVHLGYLSVAATTIGKRTFIGNSALVPSATRIGDGCLVGCLSVPPADADEAAAGGASWLGAPALRLPRRQPSARFDDSVTFRPPRRLYLVRGFIEFFRVTLPSTLFTLLSSLLFVATMMLTRRLSVLVPMHLPVPGWKLTGLQLAALFPLLYLACAAAVLLGVIGLKWVVMGRYKPCTRPLWSPFVWRTEMVTAVHETFAAPFLLNMLQGTPFLRWYFLLMGSKIGDRVCMETTQITEFDLVNVGDDACLNLNCTLQTHLFEDRVMKVDALRVGNRCSVGPMAVVLYSSEMQEGARLGGLSLLMKGETLPAWSRWEGVPARPQGQEDPDPAWRPEPAEPAEEPVPEGQLVPCPAV